MPNCIYFFPNLCIFEGWFELFKILISITTIVAAFYGLNNWSKQLRGSHQVDIIIKVINYTSTIHSKLIYYGNWIDMVYHIPGIDVYIDAINNKFNQDVRKFEIIVNDFEELIEKEKYWVQDNTNQLFEILQKIRSQLQYFYIIFPEKLEKPLLTPGFISILNNQKEELQTLLSEITTLQKEIEKRKW